MAARRLLAHAFVVALPLACGDEPASTPETTAEDSETSAGETSDSSSSGSSSGEAEPDADSSSAIEVDTSSGSETGGDGSGCSPPKGSPPSVVVEGYTLVPIDVIALDATLRFDPVASAATGRAEMTFAIGPEGGFPIFDLRQTITSIELDGVAVPADRAPFFVPSEDFDARMRALGNELAPCTDHSVVIEYEIAEPDALYAEAPVYDPAGVLWTSDHSDLLPARFAEQWMPANLPHDELSMGIEIEVVGDAGAHVFGANGSVTELGANRWRVDFPPHFTAMSPLFVLAPEALVERASAPVRLPDGDVVTVDVIRYADYEEQMPDLLAETGEALISANLELGEYIHGDRYLVFASEFAGGMEYEGGTSAVRWALGHEVFHSWIARGVRPLTHRDAWFDEAWTMFSVDHAFDADPLDGDNPSEVLAPEDPWTRVTPVPGAYATGPRIFATLAAEIGEGELRGLLREFYLAHAGELVTTEQLEAFLVEAIPGKTPSWLFQRFVYGRPVEPD